MKDNGNTFLGSKILGRILEDLQITCIDIGSRRGITKDLDPIAWAIDAYGFEPDVVECERLNNSLKNSSRKYHFVKFIPVALSGMGGEYTLHLTKHRGTSTLLQPNAEIGKKFLRPDYFTVEDTVKLRTITLPEAIQKHSIHNPVFLKIDAEGMELEILRSAENIISKNMIMIRSEVCFVPLKCNQPLYSDIEKYLRQFHFMPLGFEELHSFRLCTKKRYPYFSNGPVPFSKGQLIHGDMVFLKDPDTLPASNEEEIKILLKQAMFTILYGYLDYAYRIFTKREVKEYIEQNYKISLESELYRVSKKLGWEYRKKIWRKLLNDFVMAIGLR